jgi:hypothetical protein
MASDAPTSAPAYQKLSRERSEIRLLLLFPTATFDEKIQCGIFKASLNGRESPVPYYALSYVWGNSTETLPIYLNGIQHQVTRNLESALRHLRHLKYKLLWIDALCINQKDLNERESQIRYMKQIYTKSKQTLVWLGASSDDPAFARNKTKILLWNSTHEQQFKEHSSYARNLEKVAIIRPNLALQAHLVFDFLQRVAESGYHRHSLFLDDGSVPYSQLDGLVASSACLKLRDALHAFAKNAWWQRIWTLQESVLPDEVLMIWGIHSINFSDVHKASESFAYHYQRRCCDWPSGAENLEVHCKQVQNNISPISHLRNMVRAGEVRLALILLTNGNRDATDPQDQIYGVLGLTTFRWGPGGDMKISYSIPVGHVYQAATVFSIADTGSLAMLSIRHEERQLQYLPSWVPDWSVKRNSLANVRSSNRTHATTLVPKLCASFAWFPPYLRVSGVFFDTVDLVGRPMPLSQDRNTLQEWQSLSAEFGNDSSEYPNRCCSKTEAFWRTMIKDIMATHVTGGPYRQASTEDEIYWNTLQKSEPDKSTGTFEIEKYIAFHKQFEDSTCGRTFFITQKGYFGLGLSNAQRGDQVVNLFGTPYSFFLVRKMGSVAGVLPSGAPFWSSEDMPEEMPKEKILQQDYPFEGDGYQLGGECYVYGAGELDENTIRESVDLFLK